MSAPAVPIGVTAVKPIERHGMDAFSHFMFEPSTGAIMGRTPMSWALITVFYLIYYTLLAAFWTLCIFIFFQTIDEFQPRYRNCRFETGPRIRCRFFLIQSWIQIRLS